MQVLSRLGRPTWVEWLCLAGGTFLTIHYAFLHDDAFIYFRYADNAVYLGHGLVYNAGEFVEGFSSPLWMLLLVLVRSTGADFWIATRALGLLVLALFWLSVVVLNRRMSPRGSIVDLPICLLAFNYAVLCYFTSGLETPLVQLAAVLYALFVLRPSSRSLQWMVAVSPLLRHELAIPAALAFGWLWLRERRFPLGLAIAGVAINGAWLVFRIRTYADLLPNTFYLKNEADFGQGLVYLLDTAGPYGLGWILAAAALLAAVCAVRRGAELRIAERLVMLAMAAGVAAYVVSIGGSPIHYRYMAFPFCLALCATAGLVEHGLARFALPRPTAWAVSIAAVAAAVTFTRYPVQLSGHPTLQLASVGQVNKIADAAFHRYRRGPDGRRLDEIGFRGWRLRSGIEQKHEYANRLSEGVEAPYRDVLAHGNCMLLYRRIDHRAVHSLGLTDAILARTNMKSDRPAHKRGLRPLAQQLAELQRRAGDRPERGMYRSAVVEQRAPRWIARNLESIEIVERKIYNRHDLLENLGLAFRFPARIDPRPTR
ncbi:MAG: hypothetical protein O7A09_01955 [Proteobacteria bacterium]|nr:hypothetical protein [Pseudomonadota bacterium]